MKLDKPVMYWLGLWTGVKEFECMICPKVTLCGSRDAKI